MKDASTEKVKGVIKNVRYHNQVNGYTVATIEIDYKDPEMALHKDKIIANTLVVVGLLTANLILVKSIHLLVALKLILIMVFNFNLIILNARMWHPLVA